MNHHSASRSTPKLRERFARAVVATAMLAASMAVGAVTAPPAAAADSRQVTFEVSGAQGGQSGGLGGVAIGTASLEPGTVVRITVGGTDGFNGGGGINYGDNPQAPAPGTGGGASDVRLGGTALADRVLVAGGGGGRGIGWLSFAAAGGPGGGLGSGGDGAQVADPGAGCGGAGGTTSAGGVGGGCFPSFVPGAGPGADGSLGLGGSGGSNVVVTFPGGAGGGGGGGYHGGGGGAGGCCLWPGGGGGGGAGYADPAVMSGTSGVDGARAGNGRVRISFDGGSTWAVTFEYSGAAVDWTVPAQPSVTSLAPAVGPAGGGTAVTLTGAGLTGAAGVTVCGVAATDVTVLSDTSLTFVTPPGVLGDCSVAIDVPGAGVPSTTGSFRYVRVPAVEEIDPAVGPVAGGTSVTIEGEDFTDATGVRFGDTEATSFEVVDDTTITAVTPGLAAGPHSVRVRNADSSGTSAAAFTALAAPTIAGVEPGFIDPDGDEVTITGTGLTGASAVRFDGEDAVSFTVVNDTTITATTPALDLGEVDIAVTTVGGTGVATATAWPTPTVESIDPPAGPADSDTEITITGSGFTGVDEVRVGTSTATDVVVVDDGEITAVVPSDAAGSAQVVVSNPGKDIVAGTFVRMGAPGVELSSSVGTAGGTIEVAAEGFAPGSEVEVWINSTPRRLAIVAADDTGSLEVTVTLPTDLVGNHRIRVVGTDALGEDIDVSAPIVISAAAADPVPGSVGVVPEGAAPDGSAPSALAFTGSEPVTSMLVGVIAILAGLLLLGARRARRLVPARPTR